MQGSVNMQQLDIEHSDQESNTSMWKLPALPPKKHASIKHVFYGHLVSLMKKLVNISKPLELSFSLRGGCGCAMKGRDTFVTIKKSEEPPGGQK